MFRHLVLGILLGTESRKESASVIFPPVGSKDILLPFFRLMKYNEHSIFLAIIIMETEMRNKYEALFILGKAIYKRVLGKGIISG